MNQLQIDPAFLPLDIQDWVTNTAFQYSAANVCAINVVIDCAEREVKLNLTL